MHGCLDVTFGKDVCPIRLRNAVLNFAFLRRVGLNLFSPDTSHSIRLPKKRKSGWNFDHLPIISLSSPFSCNYRKFDAPTLKEDLRKRYFSLQFMSFFHSPLLSAEAIFIGDGRFAHFLFVAMDLHGLLEKTVTGLGYELVDVERSPRGRVLRLFIDKPEGVTIDDCVRVSNQLSRVLTVENVDYDRLEISSPGLDRPLKKAVDFERFAGSKIQLKLRLPLNGRRNFNGVLQGLQDNKIRLQIDSGEIELIELDLGNVDQARLVPEFN